MHCPRSIEETLVFLNPDPSYNLCYFILRAAAFRKFITCGGLYFMGALNGIYEM